MNLLAFFLAKIMVHGLFMMIGSELVLAENVYGIGLAAIKLDIKNTRSRSESSD